MPSTPETSPSFRPDPSRARPDHISPTQEAFASLFEQSAAPMLLIDPASVTIAAANPAACRFYGYERNTMTGMAMSCISTLPPDELHRCKEEAFRQERSSFRFVHRLASGREREVEVRSGPVNIDGRLLLHSVILDTQGDPFTENRAIRARRLNELPGQLFRTGSPEDRLRLLAQEVVDIFGALACRIWLARPGDRCDSCPHAGQSCAATPRVATSCLHLVADACAPQQTNPETPPEAETPVPCGADATARRIARIPFRHGPVGRATLTGDRTPESISPRDASDPLAGSGETFTAFVIRGGHGPDGVFGVTLPEPPDDITRIQLQGVAHTVAHTLQAARSAEASRRALHGLAGRIRKRTAQLRRANTLLRREVGERRKAEAALQLSRDLLEQGERVGQIGSYWLNVETGHGKWSDNLFRMFGFPVNAHAPTFAFFFNKIHHEDRRRTAGVLHRALERNENVLVEYRYLAPSGQYRHARQQMIFGSSGRTGHTGRTGRKGQPIVHGIIQDVTEQRQRDELLRLQRDLLLALGVTSTVEDCLGLCLRTCLRAESVEAGAAWIRESAENTPSEWRLVAAEGLNDMALGVLRRLHADSPMARLMETGRPVPEIPPETESTCLLTGCAPLDALVRTSGMSGPYLLPVLHEGRALACLLVGARKQGPLRKADRHHVEAVAAQGGSAFARILQQQSLRESEDNMRALLNAPRLSAFLLDTSGRILICNNTGATRLGQEAEQMQGTSLLEHTPPDLWENRRSVFEGVVATGAPATFRDTRDIHIFNHTLYPITDTAGRVHRVAWLAEDVAHEVALERQLRQAQKMEAMGTLAGGIAHDFNNVLGVIMSNTEMLRDAGLAGRGVARADRILRAALRAREVVRQLLAFGRPNDEPFTALDLGATVQEALHLVRPSVPASVTLRQLLPPDSLPVHGDATQIHQMLLNLCTNALHAMPDGGVLDISIETLSLDGQDVLRAYPELSPGRYTCLSVADSGHGIPPALLERIFEPFFTTKPSGAGSGLGLSMVLDIARKHGGTVSARSQPGQGARFDVLLPLLEPGGAGTQPTDARESLLQADQELRLGPTHSDADRMQPLRVLVVDDDNDYRLSVIEMLRALGHSPTGAPGADEALLLMTGHRYDVALLDLHMPGMSGLDLARRIRAREPDLPVVICTGNRTDITPADLAEVSAQVMGKPFTGDELSRLLRAGRNAI